jgi:hypothetical protein
MEASGIGRPEGVVRALVDEMPVDPQQGEAVVAFGDDVASPELVEQRQRGRQGLIPAITA